MKLEIFIATLQHDTGRSRIRVVSLSGKKGAKQQIMRSEGCPETAIIKLRKASIAQKLKGGAG